MSAVAYERSFHPNDVELVPMRRRHVRQVLRIEALVYPRPWSATLFFQEIVRRPDRVYLVARYGADVIGYGGLMTAGLETHVTTIAVDPSYQRNRLGMKLMVGLIDAAIERQGHSVSLEVRRSNLAAQALYEIFGFRPVGIRKGYYVETAEDAIVMLVEGIDSVQYADTLDSCRELVATGAPHDG